MTIKEMLAQIAKEVESHPEIMEYKVMTEGWCCETSKVKVDHNTKEVLID